MRFFSMFNSKKTASSIPEYREYAALFEKKIDSKILIRNQRFIILDTETTGLDFKKDKILSLAALEVRDFQFSANNRCEYFIKQEHYHPGESIAVHGILPNHGAKGMDEKEAFASFLKWAGTAIIVGHHIGFDIAMINEVMKIHFGGKLKNRILDTGTLARRVEDPHRIKPFKKKEYSLDFLCEKYHIEMGDRHTAAGDVFITALLFLKLLGRLEKKGVKRVGELL